MSSSKSGVVKATVTIELEDGSTTLDSSAVFEIDDRENGYNGGRTTFRHGTKSVGLLLFVPHGLFVKQVLTTAGAIPSGYDGGVITKKTIDEMVVMTNDDTHTLTYPVNEGTIKFIPARDTGHTPEQDHNDAGISSKFRVVDGKTIKYRSALRSNSYRIDAFRVRYVSRAYLVVIHNIPEYTTHIGVAAILRRGSVSGTVTEW